MNLPMIFSKISTVVKNVGGKALLVGRKHAPEILIGAGITGFVGTVGATVHATNKTNDILDERETRIEACERNRAYHLERNEDYEYSREDYENDLKKIRKQTRRKLIRAWWPVGTLGAGSVISVLSGYHIINGRYVATAAAYKTLEAGFDRYRDNVVSKFGKDIDNEMFTLKAEELDRDREEKEKIRKAEETNEKRKRWKKNISERCGQIMIFDEYSERWRRYWTAQQAMEWLHMLNNQLYDMLMIRGHLFINEVNDKLGLPRTKEGQVVGWLKPKGAMPDKIDILGIGQIPESVMREILSTTRNEEIRIPLYPEPDGIVFDLIGSPDELSNN